METNNLSTSNSKKQLKIPKAALLCLFLILSFEIFLFFLPEPFLDHDDFVNTTVKWKLEKAKEPNEYQTLFLGECFGITAFKPTIFDSISNDGPSYNLCVYQRNTFLSQYYLLDKYLNHAKKKPKFVVLEFLAISLFDPVVLDEMYLNQHIFPFLGNETDLKEEVSKFSSSYRTFSFPSWKRPMKGVFQRIWNWKHQKKQYQKAQQLFLKEKGYYSFGEFTPPNTERLGKLPETIRKGTRSQLNTHYIEKIISRLMAEKINVVLVVPSLRADRRKLWIQHGVVRHYSKYLKQLKMQFPEIILLDPAHFLNRFEKITDFQDSIHLRESSANAFSKELALILNEKLTSKK